MSVRSGNVSTSKRAASIDWGCRRQCLALLAVELFSLAELSLPSGDAEGERRLRGFIWPGDSSTF